MSRCRLKAQQSRPTQLLTQLCHVPSREEFQIYSLLIGEKKQRQSVLASPSVYNVTEQTYIFFCTAVCMKMSSFCFFSLSRSLSVFHTELFHKVCSQFRAAAFSLSPQPGNSNHQQKRQEFHFVTIDARQFLIGTFSPLLLFRTFPFSKPAVHFPPRSSLLDCLLRFVTRLKKRFHQSPFPHVQPSYFYTDRKESCRHTSGPYRVFQLQSAL